jgi:adenosylhomocysteine nucleosidase
MVMSKTGRIGIMAAMPQELSAVLAAMPDEARIHRAGRDFWVGHLFGREVVAVLSRIGKVAAATTTTLLLTEFGVSQVVFVGVAGGLGEGVRVGDVVVADSLVQHDMDASPLFPRFELPGWGVSQLQPPAALTSVVFDAVEQALQADAMLAAGVSPEQTEALGLGQPRAHRGLLASGDQFVSSSTACAALRLALPGVLVVEMEGAAVAQVCHDFELPFAIVRTISDRADEAAHVDFPRFLEAVASPYAVAVLAALIPRL